MKKHIKVLVQRLIKRYHTSDPEELAICLGYKVIEMNLGKMAGSYRLLKRRKTIFINSNLNQYQRKVVFAHEIGHALLHPKTNCNFMQSKTFLLTCKIEREANIFACELLINDDLLGQYIGRSLNEVASAEYLPLELLKLKFIEP